MRAIKGVGLDPAATGIEAREVCRAGERDGQSSKPKFPRPQLHCRVGGENVVHISGWRRSDDWQKIGDIANAIVRRLEAR